MPTHKRHPAHSLLPIALATSAACVATAALAQATAPAAPASAASATAAEPTLPAIKVKAASEKENATGPVPGYTAKRSATATKTDTPLNEVPQSISVITADQVRDQNSQTIQEVLRYQAGVRSEMYGLDNRGDWFSLRGGSEGSTLLDGLRLPLTGFYGVVRNEPYAFERIEVLRGPASVIAGQNGPGGVVNLVSKRPLADALREVELQVGTDHHKQIAVDFTGPLDAEGRLLYRLVAVGTDADTQVKHAYEKRQFIAPSITWKPTAGTSLTAYAEYQKDKSGNTNGFFPIEGTLRPAPNGFIPIDTFIGEPAWDRYGGDRQRVGYEFRQDLGADWKLTHRLRHDKVEGEMRTMYANWFDGYADATGAADPNGTYLNRTWFFAHDSSRITNADLLLEGRVKSGTVRQTLLFGVDGMRSNATQTTWDGEATPLDVYNPVYGSFPLPDLALATASSGSTRIRQVGLLAQDQIKFGDKVALTIGLRHDEAKTDAGSADSNTDDSATSKNIGAVYLAEGGWSPYASYSESFEPVAGTDFDGEVFKPKRGKQVEAGVKWAPANLPISAAASIYQLKEKNRLTADPDPTHIGFSIQRGEVTVKGFEIEGNASLPAWDLIANYTYMDARQTSVSDADAIYRDKQLAGIPRHSAAVWAVHKLDAYGVAGVKAGLGARYVGETRDGIDLTTTPSSTLVDLLLAWDRGPWRVALNVTNLTDKTYIATCLERGDCWFGTQRRAVLSMAYRF